MPLVILVGVTVNKTPLQVVLEIGVILATGFRVTVTENGNVAPQLMVLGVTKYVAVTGALVIFTKVPVTLLTLVI